MLSFNKYGEDKWYLIIGHISFFLYLIFTLAYYKERLLNCDAAYYTFHVINYEDFFIKHQRYISYFTQWAPLIAIKLGISLKGVMMSYSAIFGLWFYGMFLVSVHIWKNVKGGIYLALALFLAMRYKHYAGHTEITFAIAVASLLVIWITTDKSSLKWYNHTVDWAIKLLLTGWLFIIHPIIIVPLGIVLVAETFYRKKWKDSGHLLFLGVVLLTFIIRFISVSADSYESGKISMLSTIGSVFSSPGDYHVFNLLEQYLWNEYIPVIILFILILVWMFKEKQVCSAISLFVGSIGLGVLISATYSYLRGDIYIMIDGYLGMLGMVWGYAIYLYIRDAKQRYLLVWLTLFLIMYSQFRIYEKKYILERRLENYAHTFDTNPGKAKLIMPLRFHDWDQFWYPYEIPLETLMLSSLGGPQNSKTIYVDYEDRGIEQYLNGSHFFLNFYNKTEIHNLNTKYFNLPTDQNYHPVVSVSWK